MTAEDLEHVFGQNKWLIAKRTGAAGLKKMTFGGEKLDVLIAEIADSYRLSDEDRARLRPTIGIDVHDTTSNIAEQARNMPHVVTGMQIINDARKAGTVMETGRQFLLGGIEAAKIASRGTDIVSAASVTEKIVKGVKAASKGAKAAKVAAATTKGGPLLSKAGWLTPAVSKVATPLLIAQGVYAVGSAGFFGFKAFRYNLDCYALLKKRLVAAPDPAEAAGVAH